MNALKIVAQVLGVIWMVVFGLSCAITLGNSLIFNFYEVFILTTVFSYLTPLIYMTVGLIRNRILKYLSIQTVGVQLFRDIG